MLKITSILFCFLVLNNASAQKVLITQQYKTVPLNRKWVLPTNTQVKVILQEGSLTYGTLCNARINSSPGILSLIISKGAKTGEKLYGIIFKEIVQDENQLVYKISLCIQ